MTQIAQMNIRDLFIPAHPRPSPVKWAFVFLGALEVIPPR